MFLHLSEGLILSVLAGWLTGKKITLLFVFFGLASALALELDFVWRWLRNGRRINGEVLNHRDLFHKPLPIGLIGAAFFFYFAGPAFGLLWFLNVITHGINDELSDDWGGVQWLWPFYKRQWRAKHVNLRLSLKEFEKEYTINGHTAREFLIFLAALLTIFLRIFTE
jgi:membrane-bound metal-dependent hydrolase YbcI (DUF457 family)